MPPSGHQGAPGPRSRTKLPEQEESTGPAAALGGHPASFTPRGAGTLLGAWALRGTQGGGVQPQDPRKLGRRSHRESRQGGPVRAAPGAAAGTTLPSCKVPHHMHSSALCRSRALKRLHPAVQGGLAANPPCLP